MGPQKGQFLANLFKEMAIFKAKNMEANFEQLLGQFLANLLKQMAIFLWQKKEANFGSIFGQFKQKKGHF